MTWLRRLKKGTFGSVTNTRRQLGGARPRNLRVVPAGSVTAHRRKYLRRVPIIALAMLPTILATVYFGAFAAKQYVSEGRFVVRAGSKPVPIAGLSALLQMAGIGRSQDDAFAVQEFMTSRDAVKQLLEVVPLMDIYGRSQADYVARYPSFIYGNTAEELHAYLQWMISVTYNTQTGITTVTVKAFQPEDARLVADALLALGERLVNRMNERMQTDAVRAATDEVTRAQQRLVFSQTTITGFRDRELLIDPTRVSMSMMENMGQLALEAVRTTAFRAELQRSSPQSPQIAALDSRISALEKQIETERRQLAGSDASLAPRIAEYERLIIDREFASRALSVAEAELEKSRNEARRQQLYVTRIVEPSRPDYAMRPKRFQTIATVLAANMILALVGWLIFTGVNEHAAQRS